VNPSGSTKSHLDFSWEVFDYQFNLLANNLSVQIFVWSSCVYVLLWFCPLFSQFSCSVMSNSLRPHGLQHARPPCPSPTTGACSNSCPLSQWCHPTIASSIIPFSSCLQSFPASGSFLMSQSFTSGGQSMEFQLRHQSFHWIFRTDFLWDGLLRSLKKIITETQTHAHTRTHTWTCIPNVLKSHFPLNPLKEKSPPCLPTLPALSHSRLAVMCFCFLSRVIDYRRAN